MSEAPNMTRQLVHDALFLVKRLERRLIGWEHAIINATRNADRVVLMNDATSVRLELDAIAARLQDVLNLDADDTPEPVCPATMAGRDRSECNDEYGWKDCPVHAKRS